MNASFLQPTDSFDGDIVDLVCTTNSNGSCGRFLASQEFESINDAFVSCSYTMWLGINDSYPFSIYRNHLGSVNLLQMNKHALQAVQR